MSEDGVISGGGGGGGDPVRLAEHPIAPAVVEPTALVPAALIPAAAVVGSGGVAVERERKWNDASERVSERVSE